LTPSSSPEKRGVDWEWTDIRLPSMEFGEWYGDHGYPLTGSIVEVVNGNRGWVCVINEPTLVIGMNQEEDAGRILVMRKKQTKPRDEMAGGA